MFRPSSILSAREKNVVRIRIRPFLVGVVYVVLVVRPACVFNIALYFGRTRPFAFRVVSHGLAGRLALRVERSACSRIIGAVFERFQTYSTRLRVGLSFYYFLLPNGVFDLTYIFRWAA